MLFCRAHAKGVNVAYLEACSASNFRTPCTTRVNIKHTQKKEHAKRPLHCCRPVSETTSYRTHEVQIDVLVEQPQRLRGLHAFGGKMYGFETSVFLCEKCNAF